MDFKALMTKLETIDKKQVLTESEDRKPAKEKERDVTLPSGAKVKARTVQGWQSQKADKESDKEKKKNDLDEMTLRSSIAKELLKEFNIAFEEEAVEPEEQELDEAGEFQFSPEQEKWLGGANRQDPYILAKMPGPKPPASYFTNPEDQAIVQQRFKDVFVDAPAGGAGTKPAGAAAPTGTQVQTDDEGNHMITTPDGKTMVVGPDGKPLPNGGKADAGAATKPAAVDPAVAATREKFKALMDKLEKTGGAPGAAAGGAATKPAKKPATGAATKPAAKPTVGQQSMQQQAATAAGTDPNAVNPQGMAFGGGGLEEQTKLADDQILALIKGM